MQTYYTQFLLLHPKTSFISQKVSPGTPPGRTFRWSNLLVIRQLHLAQTSHSCSRGKTQRNSFNQALLVHSPTSKSPFFHNPAYFSLPVFQGGQIEETRQKPKCLFLKVTASGSVLTYPKLAPFVVNMPETHCCCYAAQLGSLKKPHRATKTKMQPPTYRMFPKPMEAGCKLGVLRAFW